MKRTALFLIACIAMLTATAQVQDYNSGSMRRENRNNESQRNRNGKDQAPARAPLFFVGTSTGMNNPTGVLGVDLEFPIAHDFSIAAGVGISTWGTKTTVEGKYFYRHRRRRSAIGFGLTHNSGLVNYSETLNTVYYGSAPVIMDLYPQTNLFVGFYRYYRLGRRANRFYVDAGYSFSLTGGAKYDVTNGYVLTNSADANIRLLCPGVLMIGCGFDFGFYRD